MTFNQVVRGSNPRTLIQKNSGSSNNYEIRCFFSKHECKRQYADVAELADALDLGSSVYDVQVQVLSSASRALIFPSRRVKAFFLYID